MQFIDLLNESDLKRVKGVGFDVNARVCSLRSSGLPFSCGLGFT
jgi:hypothetical protein